MSGREDTQAWTSHMEEGAFTNSDSSSSASTRVSSPATGTTPGSSSRGADTEPTDSLPCTTQRGSLSVATGFPSFATGNAASPFAAIRRTSSARAAVPQAVTRAPPETRQLTHLDIADAQAIDSTNNSNSGHCHDCGRDVEREAWMAHQHSEEHQHRLQELDDDGGGGGGGVAGQHVHSSSHPPIMVVRRAQSNASDDPLLLPPSQTSASAPAEGRAEDENEETGRPVRLAETARGGTDLTARSGRQGADQVVQRRRFHVASELPASPYPDSSSTSTVEEENEKSGAADSDYSDDFEHEDGPNDEDCVVASGSSLRATSNQRPRLADGPPDSLPAAPTAQTSAASYNIPPASTTPLPSLGTASLNDLASVPSAGHVSASTAAADRTEEVQVRQTQLSDEQQERRRARVLETQLNAYLYEKERELLTAYLRKWYAVMFVRATSEAKATKEMTREPAQVQAPPLRSSSSPSTSAHIDPTLATTTSAAAAVAEKSRSSQDSEEQPRSGPAPSPATPASQPTSARQTEQRRRSHASAAAATPLIAADAGPSPLFTSQVKSYARVHVTPDGRITSTRAPRQAKSDNDGGSADTPSCAASSSSLESEGQELEVMHTDVRWVMVPSQRADSSDSSSSTSSIGDGVYEPLRRTGEQLASVVRTALQRESATATPRGTPCSEHMSPAPSHHVYHTLDPTRQPPRRQTLPSLPSDEALRQPAGAVTHDLSSGFSATTPLSPLFGQTAVEGVRGAAVAPVDRPKAADACNANPQDDTQERRPGLMGVVVDHEDEREDAKSGRDAPATAGDGAAAAAHALTVATPPSSRSTLHQWEGDEEEDVVDHPASTPSSPSRSKEPKSPTQSASAWESAVDDPAEGGGNMEAVRAAALQGDGGCPLPHDVVRPPLFPPASSASRPTDERETVEIEAPAWMMGVEGEEEAVVKEETTTASAPSTPVPSSTDDVANSMNGREEEEDSPEQQRAASRSSSLPLPPTEDDEKEEVAEGEVESDAAVSPYVDFQADDPVAAAAARLEEVEEVLSYPLEASRRESAALPAAPQPTDAACSSAGGVEAGNVEEAEENSNEEEEGEKDLADAAAHRTTLTDIGPNTDLALPQQASTGESRSRATSYSEDFIPTAQSSASSAVVLQSSQAASTSPVKEPVPCVEEMEMEEEEAVVVETQETAAKTPRPAFHSALSSSSTSTIIVVVAAPPPPLSVAVEPLGTPYEVALLAPSPPPAAQSPRPSLPSLSPQQEEPQPQPSASLPSTSRSRTSRSLLSYSQGPSSQPAVDEEYKKASEVNTEEEEGRSETSWTSELQQQQHQLPQQLPQTPLRNDGGSEVPEMPVRPTTSEESHAEAENQAAVEAPVDSPAPPQAYTADSSRRRRHHPVSIRRGRLHRALLGLHARKKGISSSSSSNVTTHTESDVHDDYDDTDNAPAAAPVPSPDTTVTPNVVVEEDRQEKKKEAAQDVAKASLHPYADLAGTPASLVRQREKNGFEATWLLRRASQRPAGAGSASSAGGTGLHRTADDDDVAGLPESERYDNAAGGEWVRCLAHLANAGSRGGSGAEQQPTTSTDALVSSPVETQEAAKSEPAVEVGEAVPVHETTPTRDAAAHLSTDDSRPLADVVDDCVAAYTEDDVVESEADVVSSAQLKSSSEPIVESPAAEATSQAASEEVPEEEEEGGVDEPNAEVDSTPASRSSQAAQPLSGSTSASITSSASVSMNAEKAEKRSSTHSAQMKPHAEEAVLADVTSDQSSMRGATASTPLPPVAPVEEASPLPAEVPQPLTPPPPSPSPTASSSASSPELSGNNSVTAAAVVNEAGENARTVVPPTSAGDAADNAAPPLPRTPPPPSTPQQEPLPSVRVDALDDAQPRGEQAGPSAFETVGAAAEQAVDEPPQSSSREKEEVSVPAATAEAADDTVVNSSTPNTEDQAAMAQDGAGEPHVLRDLSENESGTAVKPTSDATARKAEAAVAQDEVQDRESAARAESSTALATPPLPAVLCTLSTPCAGSVSQAVAAEAHTAPSESSGSGLPSLHVPAMRSQGDCVASAAPLQPFMRHQDVRRRPSTVEPAVAPVPALNHRPSALSMTSGSGGGTSALPPDNTLPHTTCGEMLPEPHHYSKPCDVNSDKQRMSTGVHTPASSAVPHDGASVASLPESTTMWGSAAAASWQRRGQSQPQPQPQSQQQQRLVTTPPVPIMAAAAFYQRRRPSRTPRLSDVASSSSSSVEDASPSPAEDHYLSLRSERRTPREGTQPPPRVTLAAPQQHSPPASQEPQRAARLPAAAAAAAGEPSALGVQPTTHPYCYRDLMHNAAGVMQKGEVAPPPPSSSAALAAGPEQAKGLVTSRVDDEGGKADAALESPEALTVAAGNVESGQRAAVQNDAAAAAGGADPSSPSISSSSAASHRHRHAGRSAHAKRPKEETLRVQETEAGVESFSSPKDGLASLRPGTAAVSGNNMVPAVVSIDKEKDMVVDTAEGEQHRGEERRRRHSNHHHRHRRRASHDASPAAAAVAAQSGVEDQLHPSAESPRRHHRSRSHHRHGSRRRTSSSRDPQRQHRSASAAPLHSLQPHSTSQRHQLTSPVAARGGRCDADLRNPNYVGQEGLLSPTVASLHPQPAFVHHHPYELQAVRRPLLTAPRRDRVGAAAKGDEGAAKTVSERPPSARLHARAHQHRHRSPSSSSTTPSLGKDPCSGAAGKGDFDLSPVPSTVQDGASLHTGGAAAETAQTVEPLEVVDSQPTPQAEQQDSGHNTADVAALSDTREEKEAKAVAPQTRDAEDCLFEQQQQQQQPSRQILSSAEEQPEEVTLTSLDDRHAKRSSHHHHRRSRRSQQVFAATADAESGGVAIRREESEPNALVSSSNGVVAPYSAPGEDADEHRRRRHRSRHRDVVAADETPPGVPRRFPENAVVSHTSVSAAEPGELFYRDNNGDYHRIDDDEELRDFLAASAASPHRAAPLYVVHNPQRSTPSPSRDNARVLPRRVWTITDPKNPLGCSRLNPYCATCRSRYNLIFVDADMRPLRWPSPHSAEVAQMGDCRVHSGYVFSGNGDRDLRREAMLSRARERALYTQAWPERPHVPPGQLLVWEAEERARPLRQLTPPPHGRFMPVTYDTHGATTPPPLPAPRRSHSEAYSQHYQQQQQQQQRRHASLRTAREAEAELRQVYMRSATSATTTTTTYAGTERRASQQRAKHHRGDVDDAHPYAPSSASASAKVAAEEEQKKQKASGSGGDDADVRRREERRIRRALKQLLWRDLPEQRGTPEWERYMRALSKELCEAPPL